MSDIIRHDINDNWAHAGMVEAGGFVFVSYCVGLGDTVEVQVNGAFDQLEARLQSIGLPLDSVVKIDALFTNSWDIPVMEQVIKERFGGNYPARKSVQTTFAHEGLMFQLDAIAYRG